MKLNQFKILATAVLFLAAGNLLVWGIVPPSVQFVDEQYTFQRSEAKKTETNHIFKGAKIYKSNNPNDSYEYRRSLTFTKYDTPEENPFSVANDMHKFVQTEADPKQYRSELFYCPSNHQIMLQITLFYDGHPCSGSLTKYTEQGEIQFFFTYEFLEQPLSTYKKALCELKMF